MSNKERLVGFLESSFLSPLLNQDDVTDISYNGERLFYESRLFGRKPSSIMVNSKDVGDFLRQIANLSEKQFSYTNPNLDVTFSKYRVNALFSTVVRVGDEKSYSFPIRVASTKPVLKKESTFFAGKAHEILMNAIADGQSIVIAGETGCGKTELQKYLISSMRNDTRIIVIDDVEELGIVRNANLDMTNWICDERIEEANYRSLIKAALRNNPDYLIVAESRGGEMLEAINAMMSGHPIITTIHASSLDSMPFRMARMAMMGDKRPVMDDLLRDIFESVDLFVFLKKNFEKDGSVSRYVESIGRSETGGIKEIYRRGV